MTDDSPDRPSETVGTSIGPYHLPGPKPALKGLNETFGDLYLARGIFAGFDAEKVRHITPPTGSFDLLKPSSCRAGNAALIL